MLRRLVAAPLTAVAIAAPALWPATATADAPQVNAALLFLQASCGIRDARLESRRAEGRLLLTLRTPQFTRQTNLVHNDLRLFTEEAMKRNSEMPPELGACFDPASNQVINVLMELPANVASLPMAPPPAAQPAQSGGYVPPMVTAPAPAPAPMVVQATPAAPAAAPATPTTAAATAGDPSYAIQGCRVYDDSDAHVLCEVRVSNRSGRDLTIAVNRARTRLFDSDGNEQRMNSLKLSSQNVDWRDSIGRVRVINDTAPIIQVNFYYVPKHWRQIKRIDLSIGHDTQDSTQMQVVSASDVPIKGR